MACLACGSTLLRVGVMMREGWMVLSCPCGSWYNQMLSRQDAADCLTDLRENGVAISDAT